MNKKQNLHTHSTYADGKDTPEEMIAMAINRGFDSIGFSEHSYMRFEMYSDAPTDDFNYLIGLVHYLDLNGAGFKSK